jgi:hypothetical protein
MLVKMMVTNIDVLGTRAKLWKPCEFHCTGVVFKNLAVYVGLGTDYWKPFFLDFLNQKHNRKDVS